MRITTGTELNRNLKLNTSKKNYWKRKTSNIRIIEILEELLKKEDF
jgi:hypothetical protein